MVTIPTPIFCKSPDPCSCTGGGFELYDAVCAEGKRTNASINTTSNASLETNTNAASVEYEYASLFDFLGNDTATVLVSVGVIFIIGAAFVIMRLLVGVRRANKEKAEAQKRNSEIEATNFELLEQNEKIREQNKKIKDQLMLTQLNAKQTAIVEANSLDLDKQVLAVFHLNWRDLHFEGRLGSGSFGDCYKGRYVPQMLC